MALFLARELNDQINYDLHHHHNQDDQPSIFWLAMEKYFKIFFFRSLILIGDWCNRVRIHPERKDKTAFFLILRKAYSQVLDLSAVGGTRLDQLVIPR